MHGSIFFFCLHVRVKCRIHRLNVAAAAQYHDRSKKTAQLMASQTTATCCQTVKHFIIHSSIRV